MENFVHELSLKLLIIEEELKVLKDQEGVKNTPVEPKYNEYLKETKTVRENLSSSQNVTDKLEDSKEEEEEVEVFTEIDISLISDKKKRKINTKKQTKNHSKTMRILIFSFIVIFVGINARRKAF